MKTLPLPTFCDSGVTIDDVTLWLEHVPRIDPKSRQAALYFKHWNVAQKIAIAKANGTFWQSVNAANENAIPEPKTRMHSDQIRALFAAIADNSP
jgi:hypothetical protein